MVNRTLRVMWPVLLLFCCRCLLILLPLLRFDVSVRLLSDGDGAAW